MVDPGGGYEMLVLAGSLPVRKVGQLIDWDILIIRKIIPGAVGKIVQDRGLRQIGNWWLRAVLGLVIKPEYQ